MSPPPPRGRTCKISWSWGWRRHRGFLFFPFKHELYVKPLSTSLVTYAWVSGHLLQRTHPWKWEEVCFVWDRLLTCISFRELWVIIWSWWAWQRWFWAAPMFQAQLLPHLWSSPNGILNFQFGPHLNLKPDQQVKSHPQARQPLRKPHSPTLLIGMFLGKSLSRCHLKLQERTSKRKWVTESYANFMIYHSLLFTNRTASPLIAFF